MENEPIRISEAAAGKKSVKSTDPKVRWCYSHAVPAAFVINMPFAVVMEALPYLEPYVSKANRATTENEK